MNECNTSARRATPTVATALALAGLLLCVAQHVNAYPVGVVTFKDNAPFKGASSSPSLTSVDGLLTVEGWADTNTTVPANLTQWWWIFGVNNTNTSSDNVAYIDQEEAMTLQFDTGVGASHIAFLYSGGLGTAANPLARVNISGFSSDPGAYATTWLQPRISNLQYTNGTLTFDYLYDTGYDYGQLLFSNPAASRGQRLKITGSISPLGDAPNYGVALFRVSCQETFGRPTLIPLNVKHDFTNSYTTPDGNLTVKGYSDRAVTVPANFGTYVDQSFGVYGGTNNGTLDNDESVTLKFAPGSGLGRLDCVYSSGQVTISGFTADPGFTDPASAAFGVTYADGTLGFYPLDGGYHRYFFTNRAASAGQTLRVNVESGPSYQFGIAGIDYVDSRTIIGGDIQQSASSVSTLDGKMTLSAFSDASATVPGNLYLNGDWFGVSGGANSEAIEGTESMKMQFAPGVGLSSFATRYSSGRVIISGFASDPGFRDPSGIAQNITFSGDTLSYTWNSWRSPEYVVTFSNPAASDGRALILRTDGDSGAQIALTRASYAPAAAPTLTIKRQGTDVVLEWSSGVLQQSTTANGTYTDVTGATSPRTEPTTGTARFFRLRTP